LQPSRIRVDHGTSLAGVESTIIIFTYQAPTVCTTSAFLRLSLHLGGFVNNDVVFLDPLDCVYVFVLHHVHVRIVVVISRSIGTLFFIIFNRALVVKQENTEGSSCFCRPGRVAKIQYERSVASWFLVGDSDGSL